MHNSFGIKKCIFNSYNLKGMKNIFTPIIVLVCSIVLQAQPGTLYYNFGDSGRTITNFTVNNAITSLAVQPDGKILTTGGAANIGGFEFARFLKTGLLDTSFNHSGQLVRYVPASSKKRGSSYATGVILQPDRKILAIGVSWDTLIQNNFNYDCVIMRLLPNGEFDTTFGTGGYTLTDLGSYDDKALAITLQSGGKIVVAAGYQSDQGSETGAVIRYKQNGKLDSSFGNNGIFKYLKINQVYYTTPVAIKSLPNGKLLIASNTYSGGVFALIRVKKDGFLDSTFGTNGSVTTSVSNPHLFIQCNSMDLQSDGKIILAGLSVIQSGTVVSRYTKDGVLDSSFGKNGLIIDIQKDITKEFHSVCIQPDNKIVAAGYYFKSLQTSGDFYLARYTADGKPDTDFGNNGVGEITDFNRMGDGANAVALSPDNKIVLGGGASLSYGKTSFAIAVYQNDVTKNTSNTNTHALLPSVRLYPNPAQNILHVEGLSSNRKTLTVLDLSGNIKMQIISNSSNAYLNISQLQPGNYLLQITTVNKTVSKKFMKASN
jgi:uncharacterized delta-60 repeat protein